MTRGKPDPLATLRARYDAVCGELALARGERDEAKAQLKALRTEHTNACGFWVRRDAEQKATIARLRATESGAA
ncbi:hypothetical protein [Mycolicibacterium fortuitum]|uniref:Uncharacterized protein n=1 Tax=Mycolicibacterium fortuitum TaxID=1766 RepID=A0AAE4VGK5_MYCFO|nr:hypothetical protein [Mycolicibacterium fortuitum]MDV7194775.1 hypothetical protein [Mycolicibacterium fortuitum]MDV7207678.1 hypothetical protein [Mycolicibacterium fortuitum]MDV7229734.1 hypothetical protein [Mycolicibacterium fortuitum]MDV7261513.1 hypothetical protein [Mycolicibacterium fortuitum]MDV7286707.1 hypothetical protein [Mycolicibacterium fortuitum]